MAQSPVRIVGNGCNGYAPVGAALHDRDGHGVMRFGLGTVSGGARALQQAVDQNPGAASGIAVDHQTGVVGQHDPDDLFQRMILEAGIARTEYDACKRP